MDPSSASLACHVFRYARTRWGDTLSMCCVGSSRAVPYRRPRPNEVLAIDGTGSLARSAVAAWDLIGGENGSELTGGRTARLYMGWQGIGRLYVLEV